jgi:hypothetical protein
MREVAVLTNMFCRINRRIALAARLASLMKIFAIRLRQEIKRQIIVTNFLHQFLIYSSINIAFFPHAY